MQRVITNMILGYWLVFFALHACGSFMQTSLPVDGTLYPLISSAGLLVSLPLVSYGLGLASIIVTVLFGWALFVSVHSGVSVVRRDEIESFAFGGAGMIFCALTTLTITHSDPNALLSSSVYFGSLIISWTAMRPAVLASQATVIIADENSYAKQMAQAAAHQIHLAKIAGREIA